MEVIEKRWVSKVGLVDYLRSNGQHHVLIGWWNFSILGRRKNRQFTLEEESK
jgi:hypothetical protein